MKRMINYAHFKSLTYNHVTTGSPGDAGENGIRDDGVIPSKYMHFAVDFDMKMDATSL